MDICIRKFINHYVDGATSLRSLFKSHAICQQQLGLVTVTHFVIKSTPLKIFHCKHCMFNEDVVSRPWIDVVLEVPVCARLSCKISTINFTKQKKLEHKKTGSRQETGAINAIGQHENALQRLSLWNSYVGNTSTKYFLRNEWQQISIQDDS